MRLSPRFSLLFLALFSCGSEPDNVAESTQTGGDAGQSEPAQDSSGDTSASSGAEATGEPSSGTGSLSNEDLPSESSTDASTESDDTSSSQDTSTKDDGYGHVHFTAVYEPESAWIGNSEAQEMVEGVFSQFESVLSTSGDWDAEIEVYFTDDNEANASVSFHENSRTQRVVYQGQTVYVVPAWNKIVLNAEDSNGIGEADGSSSDFIINYNLERHPKNPGLLRHEMMHGLGAVFRQYRPMLDGQDNFIQSPKRGSKTLASIYDLAIVDLDKKPLLHNYSSEDGTFEINDYRIKETLEEWKKGDAGMFFRGIDDEGKPYDMQLGTFPWKEGGYIGLNEPNELMGAGSHPTWHTIDKPDRAFFRAMKYRIRY